MMDLHSYLEMMLELKKEYTKAERRASNSDLLLVCCLVVSMKLYLDLMMVLRLVTIMELLKNGMMAKHLAS